MDQYLVVNEIFTSIQGEAEYSGWPCTFVRLQGCPLQCSWCDTRYACATDGGEKRSLSSIIDQVVGMGIDVVELTGGEPLAQETSRLLIDKLLSLKYRVLLETNGFFSLKSLPQDLHVIMDIKCPGSGVDSSKCLNNIKHLKDSDEIKFVVTDRNDFDWASAIIHQYGLEKKFNLLMSPVWSTLEPKELAKWLVESKVRCRLNLQLHKYLWGAETRGV